MVLLQWSEPFKRDYKKLPEEIKKRAQKQFVLLKQNPKHPSLQIKKTRGEIIKGYSNIFEGRITKNYRFLFLIEGDVFILLRCGKHDDFF